MDSRAIVLSETILTKNRNLKEVAMSAAKMKAAVYKKPGLIQIEDRPLPYLQLPTDAIVRVTLAPICSSDIHIKHGFVPKAVPDTILGHEFVGVVEQIGSQVKTVRPGDRVAVNVETFCGQCWFCRRGFVNNCSHPDGGWALGCRIDGGQAEYVRIPFADNGLTKIPHEVSDESALFTGDLLSTGYWAADMAEIKSEDTVAVIGAGPTGLCSMMCAALYQPKRIIAIDTCQERLNLAKRQGLAQTVINPDRENVSQTILNLTKGRGADCVLEVAGKENTFQMAWSIARPNAVVCVVAMYEKDQILPLPQMYGKNLIFKTGGVDACRCAEILQLIQQGRLNTSCLITHRLPFDQIMKGYEIFENKLDGVIKIAVQVS